MAEDKELLTVVVPCLNEEESIESTVEEIVGLAATFPLLVEVVMVDDGSTDGTRAIMERLCGKHDNVRMIVNERNLGAGGAALRAFETIDDNSWVTCFPGDNEMVFSSIKNFIDIRQDCDLILGYLQNPVIRPMRRRMASAAFTMTSQVLYGYPYRYLNGIKMYRRWVFKDIEVLSAGHAINAELIAKAILKFPDLRIGEAPFVARGRASGHSKAFRIGSVLQAVKETARGYRSVSAYRKEVIKKGR